MSYYNFELVIVGTILLTAMFGAGITLMIKRRKQKPELQSEFDEKNRNDVESSENTK